MRVLISLIGCDDTTEIEIDVTDDELLFLHKLVRLSAIWSRVHCMPVMEVEIDGDAWFRRE